MASGSDNQGLQIAVIIFALLTIVMSGATFYVFKLSEDAELRALEAQKAAQTAQNGLRATEQENEQLKTWIGAGAQEKLVEVEKIYKNAVTLYMANMADADRNFNKALQLNSNALREANAERFDERQQLVNLKLRVDQLEAAKGQTLQAHRDEIQKTLTEKQAATTSYTEMQNKNKEMLADINTKLQEARDSLAALTDKTATEITARDKEIHNLRLMNEGKQAIIDEVKNENFTVADGEVRWVSPQTQSVWINLGRADMLKRQTSFSVYGVDDNGVARTAPKAKIEVTQVLGDHLAECRILEDTISDPILLGDKIHSPLFVPGRQERFAIAGEIDLDEDKISDLPFVRDLITSHGGVIDAEMGPDGKMQGEMSIHTRFLIMGETPDAHATALGGLHKRAIELGVQVISVAKFLDHIGWKEIAKPVRFGRASDPKDFQYVPQNGLNGAVPIRQLPEHGFRKRVMPKPTGESAYPAGAAKP